MKSGGVLKDYHKVTEIVPGEKVTVRTNHGDFSAKRVIITAGPWAPKIMRQVGVELPVVVKINNADTHAFSRLFPRKVLIIGEEEPGSRPV